MVWQCSLLTDVDAPAQGSCLEPVQHNPLHFYIGRYIRADYVLKSILGRRKGLAIRVHQQVTCK